MYRPIGSDDEVHKALTVIDVSNHTHVTNVVLLVHQGPDLVDCELHHLANVSSKLPDKAKDKGKGARGRNSRLYQASSAP